MEATFEVDLDKRNFVEPPSPAYLAQAFRVAADVVEKLERLHPMKVRFPDRRGGEAAVLIIRKKS